jgi:hypothetical protein
VETENIVSRIADVGIIDDCLLMIDMFEVF